MSFFDSIGSGISSLFGNSDPLRAAQIRGGMLGAAQALLQPYGNIGSALVGGGQGYQQGKENYLQDQYIGLRNQALQQQVQQSAAQRAALNNLFLGKPSTPPADTATGMPSGGTLPAPQTQAGPIVQPQPTAPPQEQKIPGFGSFQEAKDFYNNFGEDAFLKRVSEPPKYNEAPHEGIGPDGKPDQYIIDPQQGTPKWLHIGVPPKAPSTVGGMAWDQAQNKFVPIPGYTDQATAIAKAGAAGRPAPITFNATEGDLMGALAERGVALPTGFRSKEQQKALYRGILDRNPDKSPDEIADMIKTGQIEFGAQKKETTTAAGIAGKVQVFANELDKNLPLLRAAAAAVPRGNWMDLTKLMQTGEEHISDPKLKTLKGYINSTMQAYDGLGARGGMDKDKREANRKLLLSADGPAAFEAQLQVFAKEAQIAKASAYEATKSPELKDASGGGYPAPPPNAIRDLKMRKDNAAFDKIFGPGAAKRALGQN